MMPNTMIGRAVWLIEARLPGKSWRPMQGSGPFGTRKEAAEQARYLAVNTLTLYQEVTQTGYEFRAVKYVRAEATK